MPQATITALNIYPVKSMKGISLGRAELDSRGLELDRRWMVIREDGRFVTQREMHRLALITPTLNGNRLTLGMDGQDSIHVPDRPEGQPLQTRVWQDECTVFSCGSTVSDWLTDALQSRSRLHLVSMAPDYARRLAKSNLLGSQTTTVFADSAPFLVTNQASLDALNRELCERALQPVPMDRFRPNIVISGIGAFVEHEVAALSHPSFRFSFRFPCERCVIPTIDQGTAERDADMQPFKTLAEINPVRGKPRAPAFGENAVLEAADGTTITVGDALEVCFRETASAACTAG
ncbi:MOSC domain-containing protein [Elongatibacter sediminis]|uniref:MOSC N-terminal beta barrel domain-containing protein n=1 Tax=Elongatibacter sediminis TaxID=3119006 RepID=A0AAW9REE0_9GAMM